MGFPQGCQRYGLTQSGRQVKLREFIRLASKAAETSTTEVAVFAIGVSATGDPVTEPEFGAAYARNLIAVCPWELRSMPVCHMIVHEYETAWGICSPSPESNAADSDFGAGVTGQVPSYASFGTGVTGQLPSGGM